MHKRKQSVGMPSFQWLMNFMFIPDESELNSVTFQ